MTVSGSPCLMLVAGEASGDLHGATLSKALRRQAPGWGLVGMGGPRMAAAGVELVADPTAHAVVGTREAISRLPCLLRAFRLLSKTLRMKQPRALILIDFPEFNLMLARVARRLRIPVVYFIPPQVWAWRPWRARLLARLAAQILTVFPFERAIYEAAGGRVEFVGHPLLDVLPNGLTRAGARHALGVLPETILVGLLPGSRREEVERLLPAMATAARRIRESIPRAEFLAAPAATVDPALVEGALRGAAVHLRQVPGRTYEVMAAADLLLVASGTATLEAALIGTPMVVCYRVSRFSEWTARALMRVRWVSLANIVAGRGVVPELLQHDATGPRLAEEALRLLESPDLLSAQRLAFGELKGTLGSPGVGERAAQQILRVAGYAP
ncbi:MAG: lipid-A-disaccharide synthase [Candidatus Rokubacteria bacterium]|nr:lipid-A-disaccharide synthase [Candidatus Rokubacteria bacterium]